MKRFALFALLSFAACCGLAQEQKYFDLGNLRLQSGEIIQDCRIGYRTFGTLNKDGSNAVLFPTWYLGTTQNIIELVGPGKLVDSSRFFVVAVDAIGNGVSCSPSNSTVQRRMKFPQFTIADMVQSQYRLLTEELKIRHLKAVIGISMGGMQTFQWMVSHPDMMDVAVPIVGSPQLATYDLLLWQAQLNATEMDPNWKNGDYTQPVASDLVGELMALAITTPAFVDQTTSRSNFPKLLEQWHTMTRLSDASNRVRQTNAMMQHDIAAAFGGSMERAAAAVRAKVLVVVALQDHTVSPRPAMAFARLLRAPVVELQGECGHLATACEAAKLNAAVSKFLQD